MTFYDFSTAIGTRATTGGVATLTTSSLTAKAHTIKAAYTGDTTFLPSSGTVKQVVNRYATATVLASKTASSAATIRIRICSLATISADSARWKSASISGAELKSGSPGWRRGRGNVQENPP